MNLEPNSQPISDAVLAEHWFSLRNKTWRKVTALVRSSGLDQKVIADRINMDPGQFSRILTGTKGNVTLRTLHNIARAANHRLEIVLTPLATLRKPNYSYFVQSNDPNICDNNQDEAWATPSTFHAPQPKVLEDA